MFKFCSLDKATNISSLFIEIYQVFLSAVTWTLLKTRGDSKCLQINQITCDQHLSAAGVSMSPPRSRQRPSVEIPSIKRELSYLPANVSAGCGSLSPDIRPNCPPDFSASTSTASSGKRIAKYLLFGEPEQTGPFQQCTAFHVETQEEFVCKIIPLNKYREILAPYWAVGYHPNISNIEEILLDSSSAYVIFQRQFEDLHSYIRRQRRLRESEANDLFSQIVSAVDHCHQSGVIIRDLKLRKFVFKDSGRTQLLLNGLEEAHVLNDPDDDQMTDKHGCPAYVSPEILYSTHGYSGKAADVWSLGVVLYTMLIGQYPFHDTDVGILFKKIRHGYYSIPDSISPRAKCLIKNILRTKPSERLSIAEISTHPWFTNCRQKVTAPPRSDVTVTEQDQRVPEIRIDMDDGGLFGDLFHKSATELKD